MNLISFVRKQHTELAFWRREIQVIIDWYEGKIACHYGIPTPSDGIKVTGYSIKENAVLTWVNTAPINVRYTSRLLIPGDYFREKRILDIGCGPIPYALAFDNCEIYGLDRLMDEYRRLGFPLNKYSNRLTYIKGAAENMPFEDSFFDAVISVNAIDHFNDLSKVAKEISRVLNEKGVLRMEVHYHKQKICEPWALNDDIIVDRFGCLGIKKIHERPLAEIDLSTSEKERLTIWTNKNETYLR